MNGVASDDQIRIRHKDDIAWERKADAIHNRIAGEINGGRAGVLELEKFEILLTGRLAAYSGGTIVADD